MANGTTVAASVYYSDTTTYTGNAGSKTNPYCIEDLYDLINNPRINTQPTSEDLYYYYIVVNDIDMNDYVEYKYSPPFNISLYFKKIDFKNHELRNITAYNTQSDDRNCPKPIFKIQSKYDLSIHNLKLTNFISYNSNITTFEHSKITGSVAPKLFLYNCNFSIYADTTLISPSSYMNIFSVYSTNTSTNCYNCIFNIKANLRFDQARGAIINDARLYMYYSHIHLYIVKNLYSLIQVIGTFFSSYITGDIYGSTCIDNSLININSLTVSKFTNSYINVNFHNTNPKNPTPIYGCKPTDTELSCGSAFFINKSKLEGFTACPAKIGNYYELTDEECKDVNKLQEIGFLVG